MAKNGWAVNFFENKNRYLEKFRIFN